MMCRSLIANLGAANNYKIDHLKTDKVQQLMKNAQYYYITGFFHTVSHDSILFVAQHAAENNKVFMTNLSANFVPQFFLDRLLKTPIC
jgi:adenosine kinase